MKKTLATLLFLVPAFATQAGEAEVRKAVESAMGKPESVAKTPINGLWEAVVDGQIFYVDDAGKYVLSGNLLELKTGKNLTSAKQFSMLPLDLAIKQVKGNGKNVLVTWEDPNCGYCRKLAKELQGVNDFTLYTFLIPVLGQDSFEKSKAIWCAADRAKAWNDVMLNQKNPPPAPEKCDVSGLNKVAEAGRRLQINGTPALFFGTGERVPGYIPAVEIERRFKGS